ncbi:MAG: hypothetical protein J5790_08735, partial [Bacteroidaceae bacterium]|nr:hypothetical protein [Bacteroidaceae bacterium]
YYIYKIIFTYFFAYPYTYPLQNCQLSTEENRPEKVDHIQWRGARSKGQVGKTKIFQNNSKKNLQMLAYIREKS